MKSEGFQSTAREIAGTQVNVESYKIGERYFCHISNRDPGATIARAEGGTREEAEKSAIAKATGRLGSRT